MNLLKLYPLLALILIFGCAKSSEQQAKELLHKSIEAHDNLQNWDRLSTVKFTKWTSLYDENELLEKEIEQFFEFRLDPFFEGKMSWEKDGLLHVASFNGSKMNYRMGENEIKNPSFLEAKKNELEAAYFAFAQPWKLMDDEANISYEGKRTLESGEEVEIIQVTYSEGGENWWFYIEPTSFLIRGYEVQSKDHRSLIENLSLTNSNGFILPEKRVSFRVDKNGIKIFRRAQYQYSDYELVFH